MSSLDRSLLHLWIDFLPSKLSTSSRDHVSVLSDSCTLWDLKILWDKKIAHILHERGKVKSSTIPLTDPRTPTPLCKVLILERQKNACFLVIVKSF